MLGFIIIVEIILILAAFVVGLFVIETEKTKKNKNDHDLNIFDVLGVFGFSTLILAGFAVISLFFSLNTYPQLKSEKASALALKSEIKRIYKAYYPQKNSSIKLIGGSIDNLQQSTNLSKYIEKYASAKAVVNSGLANDKTICGMWAYWVFGSNIITDCPAIEKIKPIK